MPVLDDTWFRAWITDPGGERAFLAELLKPPPRQRNWTTCAEFKMRRQEEAGRGALARLSLSRLPQEMAGWSAFVLWRVFTYACRFHPAFRVMLKDHLYAELLLYAESDYARYREHIVHPYKVMAVGAWLMTEVGRLVASIGANLRSNTRVVQLVESLRLATSVLDDPHVIKTAWWLAGLFHDLGYTFYFMSRSLEPKILRTYPVYAGSAGGRLGVGTPSHLAQMALFRDLWESGTAEEEHKGFLTESASMNHSVVGGLTLLSMLSEMESVYKVTPEQALAFHLAADATAIHDVVGPGKTVHCELPSRCVAFRDRPLAWLLILCDELQDWGRPILSFRRRGTREVDTTFNVGRSAVRCDVLPLGAGPQLAELRLDAGTLANLTRLSTPPSGISVRWSPPVSLLPV